MNANKNNMECFVDGKREKGMNDDAFSSVFECKEEYDLVTMRFLHLPSLQLEFRRILV